jgi:hypothetical protein
LIELKKYRYLIREMKHLYWKNQEKYVLNKDNEVPIMVKPKKYRYFIK